MEIQTDALVAVIGAGTMGVASRSSSVAASWPSPEVVAAMTNLMPDWGKHPVLAATGNDLYAPSPLFARS